MSDQNFHEIQLNGKQLVFLFFCVVVLTVVVFLFGVSVGRGVRSTAAENAMVMPASGSEEPGRPAAGPAAPAPAASNELSYAEALQAGADDPSKAATPPVADEPSSAAAAAPKAAPAPPPPAPVNPAPSTPAAAAKAAPKADESGDWVVQVAAYNANDVATKEVSKLTGQGYRAFVFAEPPSTLGPRFKVRVGPYVTRADANRILRDLTKAGYKPFPLKR